MEPLFIGKLSPDVTDELIKKILLQCGIVVKWTRAVDPEKNIPAAFGLCEFENPEAVWKAERLVDGLELDEKKICVSVPQKTKLQVEQWHNNRVFHFQSANPTWSVEKIENEFRTDDDRIKSIVQALADETNIAVKKRKELNRENEKMYCKPNRAITKPVADKRRDENKKNELERQLGSPSQRRKDDGKPSHDLSDRLLRRQAARLSRWNQRQKIKDEEFDRKLKIWNEKSKMMSQNMNESINELECRLARSRPNVSDVYLWCQLDLSTSEQEFEFSSSYIHSCLKNPFYDSRSVERCWRQLESEIGRRDYKNCFDDFGIPLERDWQKVLWTERIGMRKSEANMDAINAKEEKRMEEENKKINEKKKEIIKFLEQKNKKKINNQKLIKDEKINNNNEIIKTEKIETEVENKMEEIPFIKNIENEKMIEKSSQQKIKMEFKKTENVKNEIFEKRSERENRFEKESAADQIQELSKIDDIKASVIKRPQTKSEILSYTPHWSLLLSKNVFAEDGKVRTWMAEYLGQFTEGSLLEETISYLMDLLPPEAEPASSSELISELSEVLENRTNDFVFRFWSLLVDLEFAWV